jgi:hypothetical protein
MPNDRRAFRLRFRDGRSAAAPFPPSLRLRFTFPFAEPQAEAFGGIAGKLMLLQSSPMAETSRLSSLRFGLIASCTGGKISVHGLVETIHRRSFPRFDSRRDVSAAFSRGFLGGGGCQAHHQIPFRQNCRHIQNETRRSQTDTTAATGGISCTNGSVDHTTKRKPVAWLWAGRNYFKSIYFSHSESV